MDHLLDRAQILVEALPHIRKYSGKTIVVKYGGNAMTGAEIFSAVMSDLVLLSLVGIRVVVVHGGGPEINEALETAGKTSHFVNGLRYTDRETMDIVQMVLCGKVNKNLVDTLNRTGGSAIGLCGLDGGLLKAEKLTDVDRTDYGYVGNIVSVDPEPVIMALEKGYIPVIATVAQGIDRETAYNINADTAASKLAIAIRAEKLILLTDVKGLMENPKDENSLLEVVRLSEIPGLMKDGVISGGMIPKVDCCVEAVRRGVKNANISDGRAPHSILIEMLTDVGTGTMIY